MDTLRQISPTMVYTNKPCRLSMTTGLPYIVVLSYLYCIWVVAVCLISAKQLVDNAGRFVFVKK